MAVLCTGSAVRTCTLKIIVPVDIISFVFRADESRDAWMRFSADSLERNTVVSSLNELFRSQEANG